MRERLSRQVIRSLSPERVGSKYGQNTYFSGYGQIIEVSGPRNVGQNY